MSKGAVRIAQEIHEQVSAPVRFVIGLTLLISGSEVGRFGVSPTVGGAFFVAGLALFGTSLIPLVMMPFSADEWDELSGLGQMVVLFIISVVIVLLPFALILV